MKSLSITKRNKSLQIISCSFICIFKQPPNINTELVSGAPVKGNADFTPEASQVAHAPKAPQDHNDRRPKYANHNINQPRKQ